MKPPRKTPAPHPAKPPKTTHPPRHKFTPKKETSTHRPTNPPSPSPQPPSPSPPGEKLQKLLAARGIGSRREIEQWIAAGRIKINGRPAQLGDRATATDRIQIDRKPLPPSRPKTHRLIAYHKPTGELVTRRDTAARPTVFTQLPPLRGQRWISVGRLDINSSGLLIFTTDGELAHRLMHPATQTDREYRVRIHGNPTPAQLDALRTGIQLEDGPARFTDIVSDERNTGQNRWLTVCLMEGRNRQVRRLWESQKIQVNRLKRVRYGPLFLPKTLPPGHWQELTKKESKALYHHCNLNPP